MRILALCLAVLSCTAAAQQITVLEAPARAGGMIKLTSLVVPMCAPDECFAVYPNPRGYNIPGCWHAHGEHFFVLWQDGDTSAFPFSIFRPAGGVL
jgi:hypothetical protein